MMIEHYKERIDEVWNKKEIKIDWLKLENDLRDVLRSFKSFSITELEALHLIDDFLASHTRRGNELIKN
jgi:hypothetical protein